MNLRGEKDVVASLVAAGHEPAVRRFDQKTETAESSAAALGVEVSRIIKSLVIVARDQPVMLLVPGDRRADLKAVAGVLGVRKVRMASPEMVLEWTGFPVGAVPPVGHLRKIPVLMDAAVPEAGPVFPAAGEINNAFETTGAQLQRITGAKVCEISRED